MSQHQRHHDSLISFASWSREVRPHSDRRQRENLDKLDRLLRDVAVFILNEEIEMATLKENVGNLIQHVKDRDATIATLNTTNAAQAQQITDLQAQLADANAANQDAEAFLAAEDAPATPPADTAPPAGDGIQAPGDQQAPPAAQ